MLVLRKILHAHKINEPYEIWLRYTRIRNQIFLTTCLTHFKQIFHFYDTSET